MPKPAEARDHPLYTAPDTTVCWGEGEDFQDPCPYRKLDPSVTMVQSADHRLGSNATKPLDWAPAGASLANDRCVRPRCSSWHTAIRRDEDVIRRARSCGQDTRAGSNRSNAPRRRFAKEISAPSVDLDPQRTQTKPTIPA